MSPVLPNSTEDWVTDTKVADRRISTNRLLERDSEPILYPPIQFNLVNSPPVKQLLIEND